MNKNLILKKYYSKKEMTKMVTSYILYYQVSLGHYAYEITKDKNKTAEKIKLLNLTLSPNEVLISMTPIIIANYSNENFDNILEEVLKYKASLHALEDFVNNDTSIKNKEEFIKNKKQSIDDNSFFNTSMKMQYLSEFNDMYKHFDELITDEFEKEVKKIISKNFLE